MKKLESNVSFVFSSNPLQELAYAVIQQAAKDYRDPKAVSKKESPAKVKRQIRKFLATEAGEVGKAVLEGLLAEEAEQQTAQSA